MTPHLRVKHSALLSLLGGFVLGPAVASADDARPCAAEGEVVGKMTQRDPALTAPTDPQAKKHIEAAKRAYGVGEYDQAIEEYTAAGLIVDSPLVLYNMAQTYRASQQYEKAIRQYRLFLDRGKPGPEVRLLVECHIRTMTDELEHAAATAPPEGPIHDDGMQSPPSGASDELPLHLEAPSQWTSTRYAALGAGGLGAAALATGLVFGLQSAGYKDDAAAICSSSPCARADEANALSDKADRSATIANGSYVAGGALLVAGTILWIVGAPSGDATSGEATTHLVPALSREVVGVSFSTRF